MQLLVRCLAPPAYVHNPTAVICQYLDIMKPYVTVIKSIFNYLSNEFLQLCVVAGIGIAKSVHFALIRNDDVSVALSYIISLVICKSLSDTQNETLHSILGDHNCYSNLGNENTSKGFVRPNESEIFFFFSE